MLGFIGCGNMAQAILKGMIEGCALEARGIGVFDTDEKKYEDVKPYGVHCASSAEALIEVCDILILAVKPNVVASVLDAQRERFKGKSVISIAAGWTFDGLSSRLDPSTGVLRAMPNTPALVGRGMTAFSKKHTLEPERAEWIASAFTSVGRVTWVEEYQMEAVTGVSGSGPAYVFMFIEAMADGGVLMGLTRPQAVEMAAQAVMGAAQMVLESGLHPGELKDMVCSPGGTTIAAVQSLERDGMRGAVMSAVEASGEKAKAMKA